MKNEYEYAKDLATYLAETHYKHDAPEWEPCEDLMGVLTRVSARKSLNLFRRVSRVVGRLINPRGDSYDKKSDDKDYQI